LSVPERLPSCRIHFACCHWKRIEISIVDSTPQSKLRTDSPRAPSTRSLTTTRAGSFKARPCSSRPIPRGLHPALLEPCCEITTAIRATDFCYRTDTDEYPRCVRLPAATTSLRPWCIDQSSDWPSRMNRAFHDARLASTPPSHSPWCVVFTAAIRTETSLTLLSPHGSARVGFRRRASGSAKITTCSAPRERWQSARDPKRLPSIEPTLRCTSRCLSDGHAMVAGFATWIRVRLPVRGRLVESRR